MNFELAERLTVLRKQRGYSQEALASALNISRQAISKWERGEASPDTENLIALAMLYKVSLDVLVGFSLPEEKDSEEASEDVVEESTVQLPTGSEKEDYENSEVKDLGSENDSSEVKDLGSENESVPSEAPTEQGFAIENDEYYVYISNGALTVTPKPKNKTSLLSRLLGKLFNTGK